MIRDQPAPVHQRSALAWALALGAGVGVAGCAAPRTVGDAASARPRVELAALAGVRTVAGPDQGRTARVTDPALVRTAGEAGGSLGLAAAVALGVRNNPQLAQAAARVERARAGEMVAFAPFLPNVGIKEQNSVYNVPVLPGGNFVPATLQAGVFAFNVAEIGTQYTVVDFGRRAGNYGQAAASTTIQALLLDRARQGVAFGVVDAYLRVLAAEARLAVRAKALERARAVRDDAGSRRRGGSAETESVTQAGVGVTRSEVEALAARQAVFDARSLLALALGNPACMAAALSDERRLPDRPRTLDEALAVAARGRDEIEVARQEVAAAGFAEQTARGEFLPRVFVRGGVIRADAPRELHTWIVAAGAYAEQELYAGGRIKGQLRGAKAAAAEALAGLRVITNNVTNQVNLAYSATETARERVRLGEVELAQAHENLRVLLVRDRNGDAILSDVVAAETGYAGAEAAYLTAIYDYLTTLARLDYAQGGDQSCLLAELARTPEAPAPTFARPLPPRPDREAMPAVPAPTLDGLFDLLPPALPSPTPPDP